MTQSCNGDQPSLPTPILHENLFKSKATRRKFNQRVRTALPAQGQLSETNGSRLLNLFNAVHLHRVTRVFC